MPTATLLRPAKRTRTISNSLAFGNAIVSVLLDAEDTGGDFSLLEITSRPGSEPPYHVHDREDETFYLLEGRVSVMVDGEVHELTEGDTMFLPRGVPHTFRIRSEFARTLLTVTPSGFEQFFRDMGHEVDSFSIPDPAPLPPDHYERLADASSRRGVRIAGEQPVF